MPPTVPINHYFSLENQQNKTKVLFYYSMLMYSQRKACFEHSNFFKVNDLDRAPNPVKGRDVFQKDGRAPLHNQQDDIGTLPEIQLRAF